METKAWGVGGEGLGSGFLLVDVFGDKMKRNGTKLRGDCRGPVGGHSFGIFFVEALKQKVKACFGFDTGDWVVRAHEGAFQVAPTIRRRWCGPKRHTDG